MGKDRDTPKFRDAFRKLDDAANGRSKSSDSSAPPFDLKSLFMEILPEVKEVFSEAKESGEQKVQDFMKQIDEEAHREPWKLIAGAAIFGLVVGLLAGRRF